MGNTLEHRFFMNSDKERRANAWINRPAEGLDDVTAGSKIRSPVNWYYWRSRDTKHAHRETIEEWLTRVYPNTIENLLNPDYQFFNDAARMSGLVADAEAMLIYCDAMDSNTDRSEYHSMARNLEHMYLLRLRHDCYALPICDDQGPMPKEYLYIFDVVQNGQNPPSTDINGFHWIHPAIPKDTTTDKYFWNAVRRGVKPSSVHAYAKRRCDEKKS